MKTVKAPSELTKLSRTFRKKGLSIGFVPTMGALHKGHLSLVEEAKKRADIVIVSIFVNPIQFGPKEDFKKYPRNIRKDAALLKKAGVDILFHPEASHIYPKGFDSYVEIKQLGNKLCGASRPGHFKGVATVVKRLFDIVKPHLAFFGEKDFQQQMVIKKMVNDLGLDVKVLTVPTVREKDGLAMSSRNAYLSKAERKEAVALYRSLQLAKKLIKEGVRDPKKVITEMKDLINKSGSFKIDYISLVDPGTLKDVKTIKRKTLIAVAAHLGKTRLIDNILVAPLK